MHNAWTVTGTFLWPEQCHILVGEGKCLVGEGKAGVSQGVVVTPFFDMWCDGGWQFSCVRERGFVDDI